jgi:hypothetical protein
MHKTWRFAAVVIGSRFCFPRPPRQPSRYTRSATTHPEPTTRPISSYAPSTSSSRTRDLGRANCAVLRDKEGHRFRFPRCRIPAGGYVKVHTGSGKNQRGDLYWRLDNFVWNNDGD